MYVDDGQLTDIAAAKGTGQELVHVFFEEVGEGLKAVKRSWMNTEGVFLGIERDLSEAPETDSIPFWPREGIVSEISGMIQEFRRTRKCPPGAVRGAG